MTKPVDDIMTEARQIAATGPISPAGRWAFRGVAAAVAGLPPAARQATIWGAFGRLAEDDPAVALHALAAMFRHETDAAIRAQSGGRQEDDSIKRQRHTIPVLRMSSF